MKKTLLLAAALAAGLAASAQGRIIVDTGTKGHDIQPTMYGIFFEEINHSGDGGLYGELIQNRGFEEHVIPSGCTYDNGTIYAPTGLNAWTDLKPRNWQAPWDMEGKKYTAWSVNADGCNVQREVVEMADPLNENTPNAMQIVITEATGSAAAQLVNTGYWGLAVKKGEKYDLRFYARTTDYAGKIEAMVCDKDGKAAGSLAFDAVADGQWTEYTGVITADETFNDGTFRLQFSGNGTIDIDYVSLFPQDTFRGRKNGLRRDVAEALEALNPAFMRWPGGCIVEGITLENRVKWAETLGDPMTRRGEYDSWGYRCTWGLGYHEALLFAEDLNMDFMFVGNLGMACMGRNAEYVTVAELQPYIDEIEGAIQYAIGDPAENEWAAKRAEAGHPEKFPLKYVELGNENYTVRYTELFNYAYKYFKEKYPDLIFISTLCHFDGDVANTEKTDMYDTHYYKAPEFFYSESTYDYDKVDRATFGAEIYVGEYACNEQVGSGNLDAALSEAVCMNNMERNSDIVTMTSYAPLISNQNRPDWACNLIWVDNDQTVGRASYWAQQLYSANRPDYNVRSRISDDSRPTYAGRIALGTFATTAQFRNVKCTSPKDGRVLYEDDLSADNGDWSNPARGEWKYEDGVLKQCNLDQSTYFTMDKLSFNDVILEVEAMKTGGNEGFLINIGCNDGDINHSWRFNVGGWNNTLTNLEEATGYWGAQVGEYVPTKLENDRWYKIRMEAADGVIRCYVDDVLYEEYAPLGAVENGDVKPGRRNMAAGYDAEQGEIVLKIVNAYPEPFEAAVTLNATGIAAAGQVTTLTGGKPYWENSFADPEFISPQTEDFNGFSPEFDYVFKPYSLTIFRIKATPAHDAIDFPADTFTDAVVELVNKPKTSLQLVEERVQRLIDRANYSADIDETAGQQALKDGINEAVAALAADDRTETSLQDAFGALCIVLEAYYQANMIEENEFTSVIANPNFDANTTEGWHGSGFTSNYNIAEYYNGRFGIYQDVEGLEPGSYLLTVQGFYRAGANPWQEDERTSWAHPIAILSANAQSVPLRAFYSAWIYENPWNMESAQYLFETDPTNALNYVMCEVGEDRILTIDLTKESMIEADWTCWDNFRLFHVSNAISGISDVTVDRPNVENANAYVFDMTGRCVGRLSSIDKLTPGVYVANGKKIVIR